MSDLVAVVTTALAAFALFVFAALQVAHRFTDHRIAPRLRAAVLAELDEAPAETVVAAAVALALVSQLPVVSLLLRGTVADASAVVLLAEVAFAAATAFHLGGGAAIGRRIARRSLRTLRSPRQV